MQGFVGHCRDFGFSWVNDRSNRRIQNRRGTDLPLAVCGEQIGGAGCRGERQRAQGGGFCSEPGEKLVAWARAETVEVVRSNHTVCVF